MFCWNYFEIKQKFEKLLLAASSIKHVKYFSHRPGKLRTKEIISPPLLIARFEVVEQKSHYDEILIFPSVLFEKWWKTSVH